MTSVYQLDRSRGCKECSHISLFPEKKEAETEVNGTREQAPNIFKGQDIHTDMSGMFPSDISSCYYSQIPLFFPKQLCLSLRVSLSLGRKTDKRKN